MTNMVQYAKDQAAALAMAAYRAAAGDGTLPQAEVPAAPVEVPRDTANGDFTTTFALAASKALRQPPRAIAQALLDHMDLENSCFASAEIAGPGFLNFRLGRRWYEEVCAAVEREGADYGRSDSLKGQKIMVEFVSANPTGPMHMGNARGGVLGDTLASVLSACGAEVSREFYVNDAGHQIDKFARSIYARCMQQTFGEDSYAFPEDGYQGDDIRELAKGFLAKMEDFPGATREEFWMADMAEYGLSVNLPKMKEDLRRYKIEYDTWFYESNLHNSGAVAETAELLTKAGWTYEKDGALWLKTAQIMRENLLRAGKKEKEFQIQFKEAIQAVSSALNTGYSVENAFREAQKELKLIYPEGARISKELLIITRQLQIHVPLEQVLEEFGERTRTEDVQNFVTVFAAAKKSGGNMIAIIQDTVRQISDKIDVKREIDTILASKRYEFRVMSAVPYAIIGYMSLSFPEFMESLYGNVLGIGVMTVCLGIYTGAYYLGVRMVRIEV